MPDFTVLVQETDDGFAWRLDGAEGTIAAGTASTRLDAIAAAVAVRDTPPPPPPVWVEVPDPDAELAGPA